MEQGTKTITMPLSEYNQLIQNSDKCFVEQYGYTKDYIEDLIQSKSLLQDNVRYWRRKCSEKDDELCELREEIRELNNTIFKIKSEQSNNKQRKWYQFWKC